MSEDEDWTSQQMREQVSDWLKTWAIPSAVMLSSLAVGWSQMENSIEEQERKIKKLERDVSDLRAVGADGFADPEAHGAHDVQNYHWHEQVFGRRGWQRLLREYATYGDK